MEKTRHGRGLFMRESINRHLGKLNVDKTKLAENILCVKSAVNDAQLPAVKLQRVSEGIKKSVEVILKRCYDKMHLCPALRR